MDLKEAVDIGKGLLFDSNDDNKSVQNIDYVSIWNRIRIVRAFFQRVGMEDKARECEKLFFNFFGDIPKLIAVIESLEGELTA